MFINLKFECFLNHLFFNIVPIYGDEVHYEEDMDFLWKNRKAIINSICKTGKTVFDIIATDALVEHTIDDLKILNSMLRDLAIAVKNYNINHIALICNSLPKFANIF